MPKAPRRRNPPRTTSPPPSTEPIIDWAQIADRAVGKIMANPKVQELGAKAHGILDLVQGFVQQAGVPGPAAAPPPRQAPVEDPRIVMGFGPNEELTVDKVKARKKALAQILHSDKAGGSPEGMMRLNQAADRLIKEMKR